jgi:hypothetical protein
MGDYTRAGASTAEFDLAALLVVVGWRVPTGVPVAVSTAESRDGQRSSCGLNFSWRTLDTDLKLTDRISRTMAGGPLRPGTCEIPNSRSPDSRFGRETGRESPLPDSAGTGKQGAPVSRARPLLGRIRGDLFLPPKDLSSIEGLIT